VLNMCDLFEDDYKEFVLGELTELWVKVTAKDCKLADQPLLSGIINVINIMPQCAKSIQES